MHRVSGEYGWYREILLSSHDSGDGRDFLWFFPDIRFLSPVGVFAPKQFNAVTGRMEGTSMSKIWSPMETLSREELLKIQSERLVNTVKRMYEKAPYFKKKMQDLGLEPGDIKSVDDLHKLPFTYKADLRDNYPFGMFCVPMDDIVRLHASSGTTGKQIVVGYTKHDLDMWADSMARGLTMTGGSKKDIIHISYGYGLFTGGLGAHDGAQKIGATVVPASVGNTSRQLNLLRDFGATMICCTPSYAMHLADEMEANGIKKEDLKLRAGVFGAEPWSEEMRAQIEDRLGLKAYDIYGLSEVAGPGVAMSCDYNCGMHIAADNFIPEIINPETGEVLPEGEVGELVFTCVNKEAFPLIRYRTRDLCSITYEPCECGRTSPRMSKVTGRSDDMLIIRGVNVFPSQIESVLLKFNDVEPHYMIYVDRKNNTDTLEIQIEMTQKMFSDTVTAIEELQAKLRAEIESVLGISAVITLVDPKTIPRSEGKAKRVTDLRKIF